MLLSSSLREFGSREGLGRRNGDLPPCDAECRVGLCKRAGVLDNAMSSQDEGDLAVVGRAYHGSASPWRRTIM